MSDPNRDRQGTDTVDLDAPVGLMHLLSPDENRLLLDAARDLGVPIALLDRDGHVVLGEAPPVTVMQMANSVSPRGQ